MCCSSHTHLLPLRSHLKSTNNADLHKSHQDSLKTLLCTLRNTHAHTSKTLTPANLFVGVGSDEAIDALLRCFCRPSIDKILTCPPTYGMYAVSAQVNDVGTVHVPLDPSDSFSLRADAICERLSQDDADTIKLVYVCSPGNPTATLVGKESLRQLLAHPTWNGIVVLDEAYIDFAPDDASLAEYVTEFPNLVVMQTLSKAFGLAGIRLGAAFAAPPVARLLNNLKAPYNISSVTSALAARALSPASLAVMRSNRIKILDQRARLVDALPNIQGIGRFRGGFDANFLLVEVLDAPGGKPCNEVAMKVYEGLAEGKGVVVRFRGKEFGCEGCLRVTVGTEGEVERFLKEVEVVLGEVYSRRDGGKGGGAGEEEREREASGVVA